MSDDIGVPGIPAQLAKQAARNPHQIRLKPQCPRDEIGRRSGFKIRRRKACQFESGRGHQMGGQPINNSTPVMPPIPPLTRNLIIACVVAFLLSKFLPLDAWFALWPLQSGYFLPWQPLTYAVLHGSTSHLFFNMLGLWMFGSELEQLWGRNRYLQFIGACVITAAIAQTAFTTLIGSPSPMVGISGAIYGLLMAYALSFPRRHFDLIGFLPMVLLMAPSETLSTCRR